MFQRDWKGASFGLLLLMIRLAFTVKSKDEMERLMEVERTQAYLEEILPEMGYVLDSVTFTKEAGTHYLRAFIFRDDEADMTVEDCAMVSRRLSKWLDKEDFIQEEYILEVCSLGFKDRPGEELSEWNVEEEEPSTEEPSTEENR